MLQDKKKNNIFFLIILFQMIQMLYMRKIKKKTADILRLEMYASKHEMLKRKQN